MHVAVSFAIYLVVLIALFLARNLLGLFWSVVVFYAATLAYIEMGFVPPVPASVVMLYAVTTLIALLLYVTSSQASHEAFFRPIIRIITDPKLTAVLALCLILIPGALAYQVYQSSLPSSTAPPRVRSVHPSPPNTINFHGFEEKTGRVVDLIKEGNPLRALEDSSPEEYAKHVERGKTVYYQNCYYCHGDQLMGDGNFAPTVKPPPANFQDPGTIAMLQEAYLFWRIAKGGPGLPDAGTPWDSTMPVWEKMLSEEDIWNVILFLYDYTGYQPRAQEQHGEGGGH